MKKMTVSITCDGTETCTSKVEAEDIPLVFGSTSATVDLCDQHYTELATILYEILGRGTPAEKKKRKSPTKKTVSSKSVQTSTASEAAADVTPAKLDAPAFNTAAVDKSRACTFCGEVKKSNAGLAQHVRHKHSKTLAQHNAAEAKKKKAA